VVGLGMQHKCWKLAMRTKPIRDSMIWGDVSEEMILNLFSKQWSHIVRATVRSKSRCAPMKGDGSD
jgi:hypothetical protein